MPRLDDIIRNRRGAMRVDVIDFLPLNAPLPERLFHRPKITDPIGMRSERMVRLTAPAMGGNLSVNLRIATQRMSQFLENDVAPAFAENKTIPGLVEWAHRTFRVSIAGHHAISTKPAPCRLDQRRLGSTGDHHVDVLRSNLFRRNDGIVAKALLEQIVTHVPDAQFVGDSPCPLRSSGNHSEMETADNLAAVSLLVSCAARYAHRGSFGNPATVRIDVREIDAGISSPNARQPR